MVHSYAFSSLLSPNTFSHQHIFTSHCNPHLSSSPVPVSQTFYCTLTPPINNRILSMSFSSSLSSSSSIHHQLPIRQSWSHPSSSPIPFLFPSAFPTHMILQPQQPQQQQQQQHEPNSSPRVLKICGVTSPSDAALAIRSAQACIPANEHVVVLIGMILWPHSKRSVSIHTAREITKVVHQHGAQAVAVFVDESAQQMMHVCRETQVDFAQLHGPKARAEFKQMISMSQPINLIVAIDVLQDGSIVYEQGLQDALHMAAAQAKIRNQKAAGPMCWTLYDAKGGGTGKAFDWNTFVKPTDQPIWFLAGGLDPQNVSQAVMILRPPGIDVATGVAGPDKCAKDQQKLERFCRNVADAWFS